MKYQNEFEKISEKYKEKIDKDFERMEKDGAEFDKQNIHLTTEWRQYLYKYILLLGGVLSFSIALFSANLIKIDINLNDFLESIKYIFFALLLSIFAIFYSIFKERENMWGQIYIKTIGYDNFDRDLKRINRVKKFLWVFFPFWFPNMERMNSKNKKYAKDKFDWKFGYFSDLKRRYTDFRIFRCVFGLNSGVVWYGRIFGMLSIISVIAGLIGMYKLFILLSA